MGSICIDHIISHLLVFVKGNSFIGLFIELYSGNEIFKCFIWGNIFVVWGTKFNFLKMKISYAIVVILCAAKGKIKAVLLTSNQGS